MDHQQDDDLYLPYESPSRRARQPHYHRQQPQYTYDGPSYYSPSYASDESTSGNSLWGVIGAMLDYVTSPSFPIITAVVVILAFQFKGTLLGWYCNLLRRYNYNYDDEVVALDRLDDAFIDEGDPYGFPTGPRTLLSMTGRLLLDLINGLTDTLRAYYQIACEVLRSSTGIFRWIPGLSDYYDSNDGSIRMMARYGGANYLGNRNRHGSNGYLYSNEPPPLETPDEDENDYSSNIITSATTSLAATNSTSGASYPSRQQKAPNGASMPLHAPAQCGDASAGIDTTHANASRQSPNMRTQQVQLKHAPQALQQQTTSGLVLNQDDIEPAFLNEKDYPPGWCVYHPLLGVVTKEEADKYDKEQQQRLERNHMSSFQSSITAGGI